MESEPNKEVKLKICDEDEFSVFLEKENAPAVCQLSTGCRFSSETSEMLRIGMESDREDLPTPCWKVIEEKDFMSDEEDEDEDEDEDDSDEKYEKYYEEVREKCAKLRELDVKIAQEREREARERLEKGSLPKKKKK